MKLFKIIVASAFAAMVATSVANADAAKGQKLYLKKLKSACDMNGAKFAAQKSQEQWEDLDSDEAFEKAVIELCPKVKPGYLKPKWIEHIRDFGIEYANDSGNVPSC
jgi:hypothetical protein